MRKVNCPSPRNFFDKTKQHGFTLIELMITVAIVAILASIAYPSYTQYIARANRSSAVSFILGVASKQEQYNLNARQFADTLALLGFSVVPTEVSSHYAITIAADNTATPPTYTITATPTGSQLTNDARCGTLSFNQASTKTVSGTDAVAKCW